MPILLFFILAITAQAQNLDDAFTENINRSNYVLRNPTGNQERIFTNLLQETLRDRGVRAISINSTIPVTGVLDHISNTFGNAFAGEYGWDNKSDYHRHFTFERRLNGKTFIYNCYANIDSVTRGNAIEYSLNLGSCESKIKGGTGQTASFDIVHPLATPLNRVTDELRDAGNRRDDWGRGTERSGSGTVRD